MNKKILHFGQHLCNKETYELFVSASGLMVDLFKLRKELEKKLFKTEMMDGSLLAKFQGEYLVVVNMVRWLEKNRWLLCE
jgi:hypothetical protein